MSKEFRFEATKPVIEFEKVNFDEITEMEEILTAGMGTIGCCKES